MRVALLFLDGPRVGANTSTVLAAVPQQNDRLRLEGELYKVYSVAWKALTNVDAVPAEPVLNLVYVAFERDRDL